MGGPICVSPIQTLPDVFAAVSHSDPLRQILDGVRSILCLEARAGAGLDPDVLANVHRVADDYRVPRSS